jgi:hypothetical protein
MASFTVRDIDPDLLRRVKDRADLEGTRHSYLYRRLLELYATHGLAALEMAGTLGSRQEEPSDDTR